MSRFYARIQGNRGEATRQGSADSGIRAHVSGWDLGVRVAGLTQTEGDGFIIRVTSGSNGRGQELTIGDVAERENGDVLLRLTPHIIDLIRAGQDDICIYNSRRELVP